MLLDVLPCNAVSELHTAGAQAWETGSLYHQRYALDASVIRCFENCVQLHKCTEKCASFMEPLRIL